MIMEPGPVNVRVKNKQTKSGERLNDDISFSLKPSDLKIGMHVVETLF